MKLFQWQKGRQDATKPIDKFPMWNKWFDMYLLFFPHGTKIEDHLDPVVDKKHFRLNITLKGRWALWREDIGYSIQHVGSYHMFRPDVIVHGARVITDTYVLSIGWTRLNK